MRTFSCRTSRAKTFKISPFILFALALCAVASLAQTSPQSAQVTTGVFPDTPNAAGTKTSPVPTAAADSGFPAQPAPVMPSTGDSGVRLGTGDLVEVSVYNVPEMDTKTRVSSNGDIYLPLVDYVHVDGLTVDEAERVIEKRLDQGGYVNSPHVQLFVHEYASAGASVLGEVGKPGVYPVLGEQTLFSVISAAGGFTDRAGKSITITRHDQPAAPITVPLALNPQDHPETNVPIYPGDTIMVRRAEIVFVVGEVSRPSGLMMGDGGRLSVLQAIALAGGTTSSAKLSGARIIRKGPTGLTELPVPLKSLLKAKSDDMQLEANDILFVPSGHNLGRTSATALQMAASASLLVIRP
jgi:polysaccharide export outer membrane protein